MGGAKDLGGKIWKGFFTPYFLPGMVYNAGQWAGGHGNQSKPWGKGDRRDNNSSKNKKRRILANPLPVSTLEDGTKSLLTPEDLTRDRYAASSFTDQSGLYNKSMLSGDKPSKYILGS